VSAAGNRGKDEVDDRYEALKQPRPALGTVGTARNSGSRQNAVQPQLASNRSWHPRWLPVDGELFTKIALGSVSVDHA
jgi:hypothetical protein